MQQSSFSPKVHLLATHVLHLPPPNPATPPTAGYSNIAIAASGNWIARYSHGNAPMIRSCKPRGILRKMPHDVACRLLGSYKITYFRRMYSVLSTLAFLFGSVVVSELMGYLIHRLLHSGRIPSLSRAHMRHHLVLYGPLQSQRPGTKYRDATTDAARLGNIGLEWLIPSSILLVLIIGVLHYLQVTLFHQFVAMGASLAWSFLMFSYVHDRLHIAGFWMERSRCLKKWFIDARDSHDIHHWALNDDGFMDKNFGIAFFFFDRLFGTLAKEHPAFNQRGYHRALRRFDDLFVEPRRSSDDGAVLRARRDDRVTSR